MAFRRVEFHFADGRVELMTPAAFFQSMSDYYRSEMKVMDGPTIILRSANGDVHLPLLESLGNDFIRLAKSDMYTLHDAKKEIRRRRLKAKRIPKLHYQKSLLQRCFKKWKMQSKLGKFCRRHIERQASRIKLQHIIAKWTACKEQTRVRAKQVLHALRKNIKKNQERREGVKATTVQKWKDYAAWKKETVRRVIATLKGAASRGRKQLKKKQTKERKRNIAIAKRIDKDMEEMAVKSRKKEATAYQSNLDIVYAPVKLVFAIGDPQANWIYSRQMLVTLMAYDNILIDKLLRIVMKHVHLEGLSDETKKDLSVLTMDIPFNTMAMMTWIELYAVAATRWSTGELKSDIRKNTDVKMGKKRLHLWNCMRMVKTLTAATMSTIYDLNNTLARLLKVELSKEALQMSIKGSITNVGGKSYLLWTSHRQLDKRVLEQPAESQEKSIALWMNDPKLAKLPVDIILGTDITNKGEAMASWRKMLM